MTSFENSNIIVTGAASGIGLAITLLLAERGATLWTVDLAQDPPNALKPWIEKRRVHFEGNIDVGDRKSCRAYIETVASAAKRIDGLVDNAGLGLYEGSIASDETYDRMISVNIGGTWNYGTAVLCVMEKQEPKGPWNSRGNIVNIASGAGLRGVSQLACYCATKHAVIGLARSWQEDFGQYGIRVNAVAPGATQTEAFIKRAEEDKTFLGTLPSNPLGRYAKPTEIAAAVAFILSDEASYVAGEVFSVTGGHG